MQNIYVDLLLAMPMSHANDNRNTGTYLLTYCLLGFAL